MSTSNFDQTIHSLVSKLVPSQRFMIYGCYGYTGELIVKLVREYGLLKKVVLAGRNREQLEDMLKRQKIEKSEVEYQVFSLDQDSEVIDEQVRKVDLVLLVAGPFVSTSKAIVDSCLRCGAHYLDITGEFPVFQSILENETVKKQACEKDIILMPGVGFDVVPTDCLAKTLEEAFTSKFGKEKATNPNAQLELAINTSNGAQTSRGTTKSAVNMLRSGQWGFPERVQGVIKPVPRVVKEFPFYKNGKEGFENSEIKQVTCMSVPWGDIATAYVSTGVPNVRVYFSSSKNAATVAKIMNIWLVNFLFFLFFNLPFVVPLIFKLIDWLMPKGPEESPDSRIQIYGELTFQDSTNKNYKVCGRAQTRAGYLFTADSALLITLKILTKTGLKKHSGCLTPSLAFGADFLNEIGGCKVEIVE
ncbi:hypothetical protein C9374_012951 [Naegleria lovaniensis]|uniref:Saccharopine dehydrogenase NADP binding domain-containing protein n=1 Tax=Naegleria lovaniensis TaxID=51637 RepID=A0AA88KC63_NAELO|nr:uncharacterized protein C9374_012951 [Naegleria lovaniensis]KAG2373008.1 hypothetical protein C9374_012951 [Naegleria lovaniensis]